MMRRGLKIDHVTNNIYDRLNCCHDQVLDEKTRLIAGLFHYINFKARYFE